MSRIIIIGGGAAGLMAAVNAAEKGHKVVLLERGPKLGRKVLISGGGRCNVTNNRHSSIREFLANYPRGSKFLIGPFNKFGHQDLINWFEKRNLKLKTESDGRVFPFNNESSSVLNLLELEAKKYDVKIFLNTRVTSLEKSDDFFLVRLNNGNSLQAEKVIIACGGMSYSQTGSSGDAYAWAKNLGHKIIRPKPSLTGLLIREQWVKDLKGLTIPRVELKLCQSSKTIVKEAGSLLFTHWGISGPGVFKITSLAAGTNYEDFEYKLLINFFPQYTNIELQSVIRKHWSSNPKRKADNLLKGLIPQRLELMIADKVFQNSSSKAAKKTVSEINNKEFSHIIELLTSLEIQISGIRPSGEEIVTAGGVCLNEINSQTMESKIVKGLYWTGEVMDIDGFTGGYNLQAAWTTGWIAGNSV